MIFNTSGGGGAALNFRVVGNPKPANSKGNCVWVDTDIPITSWIFSATEPSPAEAGMVWISVGTTSIAEFNALKKNGIQVYPNSAKQYVDGAWVDKDCEIYQNGEWVGLRVYLYKYGDTCDAVTGGWTGLSIADDGGGQWGYGGIMYTNNKVSISQYSKLVVVYKWIDSGGSSGASVGVGLSSGQQSAGTNYASFNFNKTTDVFHTNALDIASLTADAYVRGSSYYGTGRIYEVYLVP